MRNTRNPYGSVLLDIYEDRVDAFTKELENTPRWRRYKRLRLKASRDMYPALLRRIRRKA